MESRKAARSKAVASPPWTQGCNHGQTTADTSASDRPAEMKWLVRDTTCFFTLKMSNAHAQVIQTSETFHSSCFH